VTATSTAGRLVRRHLRFEREFVQVPNAWARDRRVSWRARGILIYLMSHEPGWSVTLKTLAADAAQSHDRSQDGISLVRKAVGELERYGYLVREQKRDRNGRLSHTEWAICDPHDPVDNSARPAQLAEAPAPGYPQPGSAKALMGTVVHLTDNGETDIGETDIGEMHDIRTPSLKNTLSSHVPEVTTEGRTADAQVDEAGGYCAGNRATHVHDWDPWAGYCVWACGAREPEAAHA
jgi:hypothetical protein